MRFLIITLGLLAGGIIPAMAQTFGLAYTTEGQYGVKSKQANWVNLLRLDMEYPLYKNGGISLATVHIYKLKDNCVADDKLTFSNIEEDSTPIALAIAGYTQILGHSTLFAGIRNMNEDYFNTNVTSFFTNSSCGIFPTISLNYPIANYPVASMAIHYQLNYKQWEVKASLYNGVGYNKWRRYDNPFIVNIKRDGLFSITELKYKTRYGIYCGGGSLHNRLFPYDEKVVEQANSPIEKKENGDQKEVATSKKKISAAWWVYAEQQLWHNTRSNIQAIGQYSRNTSRENMCKAYGGIGAIWSYADKKGNNHRLGAITSIALFNNMPFKNEHVTEVSYSYEFAVFKIQPTMHFINNSNLQPVVTLRLSCSI